MDKPKSELILRVNWASRTKGPMMHTRRLILATIGCSAAVFVTCSLGFGFDTPPGEELSGERFAKSAGTTPADKDEVAVGSRGPVKETPRYYNVTYRGKVVWLADSLKRRFQINTDPDAHRSMVVLETPEGTIHPIVNDNRGRGFMVDDRLRGVDMELYVRRYEGSPMLQVIRMYTLKNGHKYELDYWCDVCSIVMYEQKECECCQEPNRIRERLIEEKRN